MQRPRNVPQIGRGPQQFAKSSLPPIASPMQMTSAPQIPIQVMQPPVNSEPLDADDLAMEIYARLAVEHIAAMGAKHDLAALRELAKASQAAAMAYFQELGVQFQEQNTNG